jgi:hypothetical protein
VSAGTQPARLACLLLQRRGRQGGRGGLNRHPAGLLHPPSPARGGETVGRAGVRVQEESSLPDEG